MEQMKEQKTEAGRIKDGQHTSAALACKGKVQRSSSGFLFWCTRRLMLSVCSSERQLLEPNYGKIKFRCHSRGFIPNKHTLLLLEASLSV